MRTTAREILTWAAQTAGVATGLQDELMVSLVQKNPMPDLPQKRVELDYLPEELSRAERRKVAAWVEQRNAYPHRVIRSLKYQATLPVRVVVHADDEEWLADFGRQFLMALPTTTSDSEGNLVEIRATRAVRSGFTDKFIEVEVKRSIVFHVQVIGMVCVDQAVEMIQDVNVKDNVTHQ